MRSGQRSRCRSVVITSSSRLTDTLTRVGAPTTLQVIEEADNHFNVLKKSERTEEEVRAEVLDGLDGWITKILEG